MFSSTHVNKWLANAKSFYSFKANDIFITNSKVLSKIADMLAQRRDLSVFYGFITVRESIKIIISLQMIMLYPTLPGMH